VESREVKAYMLLIPTTLASRIKYHQIVKPVISLMLSNIPISSAQIRVN